MSPFLKILENEVQLAALSIMAVVYLTRTAWIMRFRGRKEVTFPAGSELLGEVTSLMNIAMPWAMESTRKNPFFYLQFVFFHIGVAFAIGLSFVIPYAPTPSREPRLGAGLPDHHRHRLLHRTAAALSPADQACDQDRQHSRRLLLVFP